jgi:arginase
MPGGLGWDELSVLLRALIGSGAVVGMNIGIFNPRLDTDGSVARRFVECLVAGLRP